MKKILVVTVGLLVGMGLGILGVPGVVAQTLHTWSSGQVILASDLNGNFTSLKSAKVGAGVQASNVDIASNAAISHSKLATPALVPKAWAYVGTVCTVGTCTMSDSSQMTSITFNATGVYNATLSYTPGNANFTVVATSHTAALYCAVTGLATSGPQFLVRCYDATGAATNAAFSIIVMDT